jgi:hypothetical protein
VFHTCQLSIGGPHFYHYQELPDILNVLGAFSKETSNLEKIPDGVHVENYRPKLFPKPTTIRGRNSFAVVKSSTLPTPSTKYNSWVYERWKCHACEWEPRADPVDDYVQDTEVGIGALMGRRIAIPSQIPFRSISF